MPLKPSAPSTHVYKTVNGLDVALDLYLPTSKISDPAPIILWFHGGGWVDGSKSDVSVVQIYAAITRGWAFASVDYRLAPQVKVKDQVEGAVDAISWVVKGGLGSAVDGRKIVVSGSSAGGLIAFLCAHRAPVQPIATVAVYALADFTLPSFNEKVVHSNAVLYDDVKDYLDPNGPVISGSPVQFDWTTYTPMGRTKVAFYTGQEAAVLKYVLGPDDSPADYNARTVLQPWSRVVLIHGTGDNIVPLQVSKDIEKALVAGKMEHLLIEVPAADHGFDLMVDPEDAEARKPFDQAMQWLEQFI